MKFENNIRVERDSLGELSIPSGALYGIHSYRSYKNFPSSGEKINPQMLKAYFEVKKAALITNYKLDLISNLKKNAINDAIDYFTGLCDKAIAGEDFSIYEHIIVDPLQGGAGTSLNMNINEVIANKALLNLSEQPGNYQIIHPIDHVNLSQSTNDTFVTALKIASIRLLRELQKSYSSLQRELQNKEEEFSGVLKLGRTQLQDAVPMSLGQEFGAYAQAIARDRWRLYNAEERLRSVNLGGTAIGNSVAALKQYALNVNNELKSITGLPIAKGEDLIDTTQNMDVFVEVHGIVKAGAVSLIKIANDLRLLSSGPHGGLGEISLPEKQAGSSIMPGKVNPVIPENTIQLAEVVKSNDNLIANLVGAGNLELNAFAPAIAHAFLKSISLLRDANVNLTNNCIIGIKANAERCKEHLMKSSAIAAALINELSYDKVAEIVKTAGQTGKTFYEQLISSGTINKEKLNEILSRELGLSFE